MKTSRTHPKLDSLNIWQWQILAFCFSLLITIACCVQPAFASEATPTISPSNQVFSSGPQTVTISDSDGSANIYFTTDGSAPSTSSTAYSTSFTVSSSTQVNAIAVGSGGTSAVATSFVQIDSSTTGVPRTNLLSWQKADFGVISSSSNVSDWVDMSGNGMDATQPTGGNQPTLTTNAISGLPALNFNGSQFFGWPSGFANLASGTSLFAIVNCTTSNNGTITGVATDQWGDDGFQLWQSSPTIMQVNANNGGTDSSVSTSSGVLNTSQYQILEAVHNGSGTVTLYVNGQQVAQSTSMQNLDNVTRSSNYIGAFPWDTWFKGNIAEILMYGAPLSTGDRGNLETYLCSRYGVTLPTPSISPTTGVFSSGPSVSFSSPSNVTGSYYYTLDGSTPTSSSTLYTTPFTIAVSTTVNVIEIAGQAQSPVASVYLQVDPSTANVPRTNLLTWQKADCGVVTSGSNVSQWIDASGNGSNASQTSSGSQPTLTTNAISGLPAVSFNGSQNFGWPSGFANLSGGATAIWVAKCTSSGNGAMLDVATDQWGDDGFQLWQNSPNNLQVNANNGGTDSSVTATGVLNSSQYQILEAVHNGAGTVTLYVNGQQVAQNVSMQNLNNVTRSVNGIAGFPWTAGFQGNIAELLLYSAPLSTGDRGNLETYLCSRYGVTLPTPSISPTTGVFSSGPSVSFTSPSNVTGNFYYTLDGSTPTSSSTLYTTPFTIAVSTTVNVIEIAGQAQSPVASVYLQVDPSTANVPRTNLLTWQKADCGVVTSGSNVSQWIDASGNGSNASQTSSGSQPTLTTNAISGLPAVSFNGSQTMSWPSGFANLSGATMIVVAQASGTSNCALTAVASDQYSDDGFQLLQASPDTMQVNANTSSSTSSVSASGVLNASQYQILEAVHNGAGTVTLYLNGQQVGQSTSMLNLANVTRTVNEIGGFPFHGSFDGNIAEILFYSAPLSSTDRGYVETYLANRYSVTLPSPAISPSTGVFSTGPSVTLSSPSGALTGDFYYTTNGSTPTSSSSLYSAPFTLSSSATVKVIEIAGASQSPVSSAYIQVDPATSSVTQSGLMIWHKSDNQVTTSGSNVTAWADVSGNGNTASNSTTADQPTITSNAINGLPAINFDGTSTQLNWPAGLSSLSSGGSLFLAVQPITSSPGAICSFANSFDDDGFDLAETTNGTLSLLTRNSVQTQSQLLGPLWASQYQVLEAVNNGSGSATLYINGSPVAQSLSMGTINNTTRSQSSMGTGYNEGFFEGQIAEMLLYNRPVTDSERQGIEKYLIDRYALNSTSAVSAPLFSIAGGTLPHPTQIGLSSSVGSDVHATVDGSTPTSTSPLITTPIQVNYSQTIKAISVAPDGTSSGVASQAYTLDSIQWPAPDASDTTPLKFNIQLPSTGL